MKTVKETSGPSSETTSGPRGMDFLGLRALFRWLGGKSQKATERFSLFEETPGHWYVLEDTGYGASFSGPYKRKQDAKGVRTRLIKQRLNG